MVLKSLKKLKYKKNKINPSDNNSKKKNKIFKRNILSNQLGGQETSINQAGNLGNNTNLGDINQSVNNFDLEGNQLTNQESSEFNEFNEFNQSKKIIKTGTYNKNNKEALSAIEREQQKARKGLSLTIPPINTTKEEALLEKTENTRVLGFGNYQHIVDESVKPKFTANGFYPSYLSFNKIQKINEQLLKNNQSNKNNKKNNNNTNINNNLKELNTASTATNILEEAGNVALETAVI